jgi:TonB family protein
MADVHRMVPYYYYQAGESNRTWLTMMGLSLVCHLLFMAGMIYIPQFSFSRNKFVPVIDIDLMAAALPGPRGGGPPAEQPAPRPKPEVQQPPPKAVEPVAPVKAEEPEPPVVPKNEVKYSLKSQTFHPQDVVKSAVEQMRKEINSKKGPADAIENMRRRQASASSATAAPAGSGVGVKSVSGGGGGGGFDPMGLYNFQLQNQVNQNWALPDELAGSSSHLRAVVMITIQKNGAISDIWFEERSGNAYFDDSVYRAVKKSNPAPPLPPASLLGEYTVGLEFTPPEREYGKRGR